MIRTSTLAFTTALALSGCAMVAPPSSPVTGTLPTLHKPAPAAFGGMTVRSLIDGTVSRIEVAPHGDGVRTRDADGCVADGALDWFAPNHAYAGCGTSTDWKTASGEVRVLDSLYPLTLGSTGEYERQLVSATTGDVSTRTTGCEVTGAVAVERTGSAPLPAYIVACDDGRITRTTWYAPEIGPLAYREVHDSRGVREAWIRVE